MAQALMVVGTLAGVATSLVGGMMQAQAAEAAGAAQEAQYKYQAQVAEMNAQIAQDNAERRRSVAQLEAQRSDEEMEQVLGQQLAGQSASGVDLGSRSAVGARKAAKVIGRRDALNLIQEGELDAYNYLTDKANYNAEAEASLLAGRNARQAGRMNARVGMFNAIGGAFSSLVSGARSFNSLGNRRTA